LQDPGEIDGDDLNNVRCEARNEKGKYMDKRGMK
jgi:hypothetical protein